mmetsp:Transcript_10926/g.12508  ORF Transcript_10926/g.12508 Transcript_10926/m.12508 type:complete len:354 (+) Transcript_10926:110-1171(+)
MDSSSSSSCHQAMISKALEITNLAPTPAAKPNTIHNSNNKNNALDYLGTSLMGLNPSPSLAAADATAAATTVNSNTNVIAMNINTNNNNTTNMSIHHLAPQINNDNHNNHNNNATTRNISQVERAIMLQELGANSIERRKQSSNYFDASSLADPDPIAVASCRGRGGVSEPFPERLHRLLKETEQNNMGDIVSFFPHGRAFAVQDQTRFVREVMPKYFNHSGYSSFQRQLNLYGFIRILSGPDAGGYYHELFLKGRTVLASHMRRVRVQSKNKRLRHDTPNFYGMIPVREKQLRKMLSDNNNNNETNNGSINGRDNATIKNEGELQQQQQQQQQQQVTANNGNGIYTKEEQKQ